MFILFDYCGPAEQIINLDRVEQIKMGWHYPENEPDAAADRAGLMVKFQGAADWITLDTYKEKAASRVWDKLCHDMQVPHHVIEVDGHEEAETDAETIVKG